MFKILIAEDDKNTRRWMEVILEENGYETKSATDGKKALEILDTFRADLIILDVMMPNMDGYEAAREIRSYDEETPILMISAKQNVTDRKEGFLSGIDDYMVKPVDEEEMLLRIKALLRRTKSVTEHKLVIGDVTLDYDSLSVIKNGEVLTLPQKEFYLLFKLLSSPDKIFTRIQLMDEIWGMESESSDNTVNVHINRLRNRFENYPEFEIVTIRGLGYKGVKKVG